MANHHSEYMSTCYANESICEAKIDIQQNSFVCDKLSFDNFHGCVPVTPLELGENNFSFSLKNIYPIWFKYTLNEVSSLKYDIELTNSSQFIEKNLYAFLVKNNEELSAYSSGNSMLNLDAKYLEANTYYLNLFPFEFQAITATSHDFKINLQAENEVCEDNSDCYEVLGRSICEENSCKVNNSFGNVSLNHRCDLDKNCNSVFYEPVCLDRVSSLDNSFGGLCSLPCGLGGIESDIYCSEKLNSSGYYCTEYNERNYCLPRCSNDSDCLIGLNQGRCIMDNQRNANICIFN
jgi:hypothetical protein